MENSINNDSQDVKDAEFKMFATKRIVVGILLTVVVLWVAAAVMGWFDKPVGDEVVRHHEVEKPKDDTAHKPKEETAHAKKEAAKPKVAKAKTDFPRGTAGHIMSTDFIAMGQDTPAGEVITALKKQLHDASNVYVVDSHDKLLGMVSLRQLMFADAKTPLKDFMVTNIPSVNTAADEKKVADLIARKNISALPVVNHNHQLVGIVKADEVAALAHREPAATAPDHKEPAAHAPAKEPAHKAVPHEVEIAEVKKHHAKGVLFIKACIEPLEYELHERFWGWRPNDVLNFTDNVNSFQLGVLEVTRRTAVILTERISRTGTTAAFDKNLENAMNWFMIKSNRYWFPSPESKYSAGLKELGIYKEKLEKGEANFHTRTDNLIPLLMAYEDLLGSCDENLVKQYEDDGTAVSYFKADDYFFYAQGVASAMYTILEAILEEFHTTVESRRGLEVLHHAIESCHHAVEIDPWMITNSSWSGILANHRANMAAPISHARFYIGVLIKTLST